MRPRTSDLPRQREQAKAGLAVSLGVLVATGFLGRGRDGTLNRTARTLHLGAGLALVGFSYWHWSLYQPSALPPGQRGRLT